MKLKETLSKNMTKICVIGLGYVGLPILINLSKKFNCIGYDINSKRVNQLSSGKDIFNEFSKKTLKDKKLFFTSSKNKLKEYNLFIVAVPTPIYENKKPDLSHIGNVCKMLSKILKLNDIVIFESTVYPGVTEDFCVPLLQRYNRLKIGKEFFVGYSPERVNPGDKSHDLKKINKILSYPYTFKKKELMILYKSISKKIIFTQNIKEAELAKVIENIQRDVNIGLINEIYLVCRKLKINFSNVIKLASTKWNFLKFQPGLVGGHCLPVDPYYLSYISKKNNFKTKITLAGRSINDSMKNEIKNQIENKFLNMKDIKKKKVLICGLTYKKNVADLRNSLSLEIYKLLKKKFNHIVGYDPLVDDKTAKKYKFKNKLKNFNSYDIYVDLVSHDKIKINLQKVNIKKILSVF